MDCQAQMHVLETVLVAVLFTSAMNVAVSVLPTTVNDVQQPLQLQLLGRDTLALADTLGVANSSLAITYANSSLKLWLFAPDRQNLSEFLNQTLPDNVAYRLLWRDEQGRPAGEVTYTEPVGEVVVVERLVYHQGLYQVQLQLWYGLRGVA